MTDIKKMKRRPPKPAAVMAERPAFLKSNRSPVEGVPFVQFRGKGKGVPYPEYFELMANAMTDRFGRRGTFWETDEPPTIEPVNVDDLMLQMPDAPSEVLERILEKRILARDRRVEELEDDKVKMYGMTLLTITPEGADFMKRRQEWPIIERTRDPVRLKRLVTATHSVTTDITTTPLHAQRDAQQEYFSYRQGHASDLKYAQGFRLRVQNLTNAGVVDIPSDAQQALDFICGLDDARYSTLKTDLKNEETMRVARGLRRRSVYPSTLADAVSLVAQWEPTAAQRMVQRDARTRQNNSASAFVAETNETTGSDRPEPTCWDCGEVGHKRTNCPNKKQSAKTKSAMVTDVEDNERKPHAAAKKKQSQTRSINFATHEDCMNAFSDDEYDDFSTIISAVPSVPEDSGHDEPVDVTPNPDEDLHTDGDDSTSTALVDSDSGSESEADGPMPAPAPGDGADPEQEMIDPMSWSLPSPESDGFEDLRELAASSEAGDQSDDEGPPGLISDCDSDSDSDGDDEDVTSLPTICVGAAVPTKGSGNLKPTDVCMDSGATGIVIHNADLLVGVHRAKTSTRVLGMGGETTTDLVGHLPGFGKATVIPTAPANVLPLCMAEDLYHVDFVRGSGYIVTIADDVQLFFERTFFGLYVCDFNAPAVRCLLTTVSGNEARFTAREVAQAGLARRVMEQLGYPSSADLKTIIQQGGLINMPITTQDVARADVIYGRDVGSVKGKSTRKRPAPVPAVNPVPKAEVREQKMYADIFHLRRLSFLISVMKPTNLLLVRELRDRYTAANAKDAIAEQIRQVEDRGFRVAEVTLDPDPAFGEGAITLDRPVTYVGAGAHVPIAERAIRVVKERYRALASVIGYKVPRRFVPDAVKGIVSNINLIPSRGDNDTRSSFERVVGIKPDFRWFGELSFGAYCQIPNRVSDVEYSSEKPRTIGAIAMRHVSSGVWKFYSLSTGGFVTRRSWQLLPTPDVVLEKIKDLYVNDENVQNIVERLDQSAAQLPDAVVVDPIPPEIPAGGEEAVAVEHEASVADAVDSEVDDDTAPSSSTSTNSGSDSGSDADSDSGNESGSDSSREDSDGNGDGDGDAIEIGEPAHSETEQPRPNSAPPAAAVPPQYGSRIVAGRRRSSRARRPTPRYAFHVSLKAALEKHGEAGKASVRKELEQMVDKKVWQYINFRKLSAHQRRKIIRSMVFLKEKFDSTGEFEKLKARLVAGGHMQGDVLYSDSSSPTVPVEVVFVIIGIAARERRILRTVDITGAYLECNMTDEVLMSLDATLTELVCEIDPTARAYVDEKGRLVVRLKKALYGCKQSGLLWYKVLCAFLTSQGFTQNPYERCLFNKTVDGAQISACFHVDDLLISCTRADLIDELVAALNKRFNKVTEKAGDTLSYLGMTITTQLGGNITVSMERYVDECLGIFVSGKVAATPATEDLFEEPKDEPLDVEMKERFHSAVAKILYLAKRVRPELLTAISHLASRVATPTMTDWNKLKRVFSYVRGTKKHCIIFLAGSKLELLAYIDASYAVHADFKSRSGMFILFCGGVVCALSKKQKLMTKSSTEAELVALSDGSTFVLWLRNLLGKQGYPMGPSVIYQDNQSVLAMLRDGGSNSLRTRHINIRFFFVRDYISSGALRLEFLPTEEMLADINTKPVVGAAFRRMVGGILHTVE